MGKRNNKSSQRQIIKYEYNNISQDRMIEIYAEAYYRALKKVELEKSDANESVIKKKKDKWYINMLFVLNVLFWPWKINRRFNINNRIYDSILVLFVSGALQVVGVLIWLFGILAIIYEICQMIKVGISNVLVTTFSVGILSVFLGSTFVLASREFSKEVDSNKIYAYSACVIALISCVVSIIALLKM